MQTCNCWSLLESLSCKELSERVDEQSAAVLSMKALFARKGKLASFCWVCFNRALLTLLLLGLYMRCGFIQAHNCHSARRVTSGHNRKPRTDADAGERMGCRIAQCNLGAVHTLGDIPHLQITAQYLVLHDAFYSHAHVSALNTDVKLQRAVLSFTSMVPP